MSALLVLYAGKDFALSGGARHKARRLDNERLLEEINKKRFDTSGRHESR